MNKTSLHIVNSCYNPTGDWAQTYILQAQNYARLLTDYEVLFVLVNDGSTNEIKDEVLKIENALQYFEYYEYNQNKGKGHALRHGIYQTEASLYCYTDVDFPYEADGLQKMANLLQSKSLDVILGTRNPNYFKQIPLQRRLISKSLIGFNKYFLRLQYPDTQCGIKLISHTAKETFLAVKNNGFLFEVEFIKKAEKTLKIDVQEVTLRTQTILKNVKASTLFNLLLEYLKLK